MAIVGVKELTLLVLDLILIIHLSTPDWIINVHPLLNLHNDRARILRNNF